MGDRIIAQHERRQTARRRRKFERSVGVNSRDMIRFGIDLGGTKIEIVALDRDGSELIRRRVGTPEGDYEATIAALAGLVHDAEAELGVRGSVGIGTPGSISPATGLLRGSNSVALNGREI